MSELLLSNAELKVKAGVKQDKKLVEWLNERRIPWIYDAKHRPMTTLSAFERVLFAETADEVDF